MSDQLPFAGSGMLLAATGVWLGQWWLAALAVGLVVVGAVVIRVSRRRAHRQPR